MFGIEGIPVYRKCSLEGFHCTYFEISQLSYFAGQAEFLFDSVF